VEKKTGQRKRSKVHSKIRSWPGRKRKSAPKLGKGRLEVGKNKTIKKKKLRTKIKVWQ